MNVRTLGVRAEPASAEGVLAELQDRIGPQRFNAWFRHGTQVSLEGGHVRISVPNPFVANWIETHYRQEIAAAVEKFSGRLLPVVVMVDPAMMDQLRKPHLDRQAELVAKAGEGRARPRRPETPAPLRYRLEDFVVGSSNRLAYSSATALADGTGAATFRSLFVHGSCGVGKTHLLQGICNAATQSRRDGRGLACHYVTGEQFTNEFISSMRQRKFDEFRARYRRLDLLAIDDVHFFAAKKATQEEFLHTFNAIDAAGKRVVLASDAHPHLVGELNRQLVSRFLAGMVVKIEPPDPATRREILRRKAAALGLGVAEEVLEFVAAQVRGSVRELEGALVKLAALSALERGPVTLGLASRALADHLARTDSATTLGDIEAGVCAYFGITPADLHSTRRTHTVSLARMIAMHLARRHTQMSFPEIGRFMGKNHSSVVLACQRMEALLASRKPVSWMTPAGNRSLPADKLLELLSGPF